MQLSGFYKTAQNFYGNVFAKYGEFVGRHPIPFIVTPMLVFGLLGLGLLRLESETDVERLYTPMNSQADQDRERMKAMFPDMTGTNYNSYSLITEDRYGEVLVIADGDVFANDSITEIRDLVERIKRFEANIGGQRFEYPDACARSSGICIIGGSFILTNDFISNVSSGIVTYPFWNNVDLSLYLSGAKALNQVLNSASGLKLTFHLRQDNETMKEQSLLWENAFISKMKNESTFMKEVEVSFATSQSLGDELNDNTNGDVYLFSLSFTLLITYATIVSGGDCVGSRNHLARAGVIAAGLGILGALGLVSLCGVKFVNIVGIMPILVLSIGVDDMFLMMSAWADTNRHGDKWDIPKRLSFTFRLAGVGVTITSLTDLMGFVIGSTSTFMSVKNFCIYTGTAIGFCYLAQVTFFAGCLTFQGFRVEESRHCCTCLKISAREDLKEEGQSCCIICFCGGKPPRDRQDCFLETLPQVFIKKYVLTAPGKIITIVLSMVYLAVSIWGVTRLEQGLYLNNLVPPSSYYHDFSLNNYHYFETRIPVSFVFDKEIDYRDSVTVENIERLLNEVKQDATMKNATEICWLKAFMSSPNFNNDSESSFVSSLKTFLQIRYDVKNDVVFGSLGQSIIASRCTLISNNVRDSTDQATLMTSVRAIANNSPLPVFPYHPMFVYFEQYVSVAPAVFQNVGIAVGAMIIVTAVFLPHPFMLLAVLFNIILILLGIFGFMALWGLSLSSITMIHLVMSVGFSVDFTVHVSTAYMLAEGETREERAKNAITHAAGPIFNGGLSTFIGIVTLAASKSYVFQSFFKIMVLVILFGVGSAVLLMPVLLSLVGPMTNDKATPLPTKTNGKVMII